MISGKSAAITKFGINIRLVNGKNLNLFDTSQPYQWEIDYPVTYNGFDKLKATALFGDKAVISNEITILVRPPLGTSIVRMMFDQGNTSIPRPGESESLKLLALFDNHHKYNITEKVFGTSYLTKLVKSGSPLNNEERIVNVDINGKVIAIKPGKVDILAINDGITAIKRIIVKDY